MQSSDHIVDIGPGAGVHGGKICAQGTAKEIANSKDSITGQYLSGTRQIEIPKKRKKFDKERLIKLTKAEGHNLKSVNLELPLDLFVCITGVSGSGKSTLINQTLLPAISNEISRAEKRDAKSFSKLTGIQDIDKIIEISQSPIGRLSLIHISEPTRPY